MAIARSFERFYNFLANLGLVLRDDPPKVIDVAGREWGPAAGGLAVSIREIAKEDRGQPAVLSVVIRNEGPEPKDLVVPGWLFFYEAQVAGPDGSAVPLSPYGSRFLKAERNSERLEVSLGSGEARETDLPLGTLYGMQSGISYRVRVQCRLKDGAMATSNEIAVRA